MLCGWVMISSMNTTSNGRKQPNRKRRISGFTLIEMMVVVLIVSIIVGATFISVSVGERGRAKEVGKRMTTLMSTLSNESVLSGLSYGLYWDKRARIIRVLCFDTQAEKWVLLSKCSSAQQIRQLFPAAKVDIPLPSPWGMIFTSDLEGVPFAEFGDVANAEYQDDIQVETEEEKEKEIMPWVRFDPTGLWQPDGIVLLLVQNQPQNAFRWTATGRILPTPLPERRTQDQDAEDDEGPTEQDTSPSERIL